MNLPALIDAGLQSFGLRPKAATSYDLRLLQKELAGTDYLGRTNPLSVAGYEFVGGKFQYVDPATQQLRQRLVGQVGRVNSYFAKKVAALPWTAWRRGANGQPEQLNFDAPVLELLWKPNPMTSFGVFMRQISTLYHGEGNVYIWANRLEDGPNKGKAQELWILPPNCVEPRGGGPMKPVEAFRYTPDPTKPGEYEDLDPAEILHLKNDPLPTERKGISVIQSAFREATVDKSTSDATIALMQNQGPPGLLSFPPAGTGNEAVQITLSAPTISDIRNRFDRNYAGPHNRGKIPIVTEKVEYVSTGATAVDLAILELRQANFREICGWWGFSAVLLGDMEASTDNNYQNARKALYTDALLPYLGAILPEFSRWLCPMFEKGTWLDVDVSNVPELQENKKELAEWLALAWWVSAEQKATMLGVTTTLTGHYIPAGLVHAESTGEGPDAAQKLLSAFGVSDYK